MPDTTQDHDEVLIRRIRKTRDFALFGDLFRRYSKTVYYSCLRVVENGAVAEDLTQDTFLNALAQIDRYQEGCFEVWLKVIARNLYLNWLQSAAKRLSADLRDAHDIISADTGGLVSAGELESAVAQLLPDQRRCVRLLYYQGCTYREIENSTGMSDREVKTHLQTGLRNLRHHFGQVVK